MIAVLTESIPRAGLPLRPGLHLLLALILGQLVAEALRLQTVLPGALATLVCLVLAMRQQGMRVLFGLLMVAMCGLGLFRQAQVIRSEAAGFAALAELPSSAASLAVVRGTVESMPRRSSSTWSLYLRPGSEVGSAGQISPFPETLAVTIPVDRAPDLELSLAVPGDEITVVGAVLDLPQDRLSTDPQQWHRERGAIGLVRAQSLSITRSESTVARGLRFSQRAGLTIETQLTKALPGHEAALLLGMMTGKMHLMTYRQTEHFGRTGLLHLFSVSGLHTMLVGGMALLLLRFLGLGIRTRLVILAILLAFFASLVGIRTAVLRACCLLLLMESRGLLGRNVEPLAALGSIALLFLLIWPRVLWQIDFQLTFLCMLAITLFAPWSMELRIAVGRRFGWGWRSTLIEKFLGVLCASTVIQVMMAPVLLSRFGEVSLVAPIANALLLLVAVLCVKVGFVLCIVGLGFGQATEVILQLLRVPLELLNMGAALLASPSWAVIQAPAPGFGLSALYMAVILAGPWNRLRSVTQPRRSAMAFVPSVILLLTILLLWRVQHPWRPVEVHFLDVGQGDATLIRARGADWLVDGGPPGAGRGLATTLRSMGVTQLAGVVATHADADHIGGLPFVMAEFPVGAFYVNGEGAPTTPFALLEDTVERNGIAVYRLEAGASIALDAQGTKARVLHPSAEFLGQGPERNDSSISLAVEVGESVILLVGDAEYAAESAMLASGASLAADVLKAGHHGAGTSSSVPFLAAVGPRLVVVSSGRGNRFGHPAREALERFAVAGAQVLRTDRQGSVRLVVQPNGRLHWSTERGMLDFGQ
jgi:competence protein ComEC